MRRSFLQSYLTAFNRIEGWFSYDAALMFMAYNQLIRAGGISGDVLEIGVYHGLSSIAVASLRGPGRKLYAIDLFEELQANQGYGAGASYRKYFEENIRTFYEAPDFLVTIAQASGQLKAEEFSTTFSFCHVDGGHSPQETYDDLKFASDILLPGGLLALDDYFNPQHPGVCEGAIAFLRRHEGVLKPIAIGFNKVLLQRLPSSVELNEEFSKCFPAVSHSESTMWNTRTVLFQTPLRSYFDLYASTPELLVPLGASGTRATFTPEKTKLRSRRGKRFTLPVAVRNTSSESFPGGERVIGLSYHLRSEHAPPLQQDNERTYLKAGLDPGAETKLKLSVAAPASKGIYQLEIDLVWEDVMWFQDVGNPTCIVELEVR